MKVFAVDTVATLKKTIKVEAESPEEALKNAEQSTNSTYHDLGHGLYDTEEHDLKIQVANPVETTE